MRGVLEQVGDFFEQGGYVMPPLVLGAMLLWYALGYRMLVLRRGRGGSVRELIARYERQPVRHAPRGVIDRAVFEGLALARKGVDDLRRHLDVAFSGPERDIAKFGYLASAIVVVAPLAGLLGTVSGMIETFDSLGEMALFTQSGGIAGGISEALFSTQMGLAVAIPGLLVGRVLARKQARLQADLDQIKNLLCAREAAV